MMEPSSPWSQPHPSQFRPPAWQGPVPPTLPTVRNAFKEAADRSITPEPIIGALVASLDPAKIQEVAASQLVIIDGYYKSVLRHAQQLFRWALIAAGVGLLFFLAAVSPLVFRQPANVSIISLICGGVVEGIAALNFLLYGRTLGELEKFHARLDRTQQYLLANSICEKLDEKLRQTAKAELVRAIMETLVPSEKKPKENPPN
jgi:hypothetical protein